LDCIRNGFQARFGDLQATGLALAINSIFDPLKGRFDLIEGVSLAAQQTQREFLIEVAGPKFGHLDGHTMLGVIRV
jgi:hypothetical protein